ncbi:LOB domain-containing protein 16 [Capsicum baccatum]|uniref:LOB domain-containing protein 16 n=1 Tax=Capsicum baccatum TaxID=33114 RepID=A0A2G2WMW1_CAPBA|nr:LOB domain-containing protein 16-like [Capsicum annuum]KAF3634274.1 LOB domain-containing protein 16 [Capsicum annuum]KAF3658192.1 LOB domain-containing protein 16 [Capsicum annuum]PHT46568.1 LOB domain-containing protein 16 [Capsicum baccatum]
MASSSSSVTGGTGSPCGACKFLRRKCVVDCIFAPYFNSEEGPSKFAAIHKVFGASNVSKLLHNVPVDDRCDAVVTIAYEAQARIKDPVYGCVANIFALQQQVAYLQSQVMQVKAQLAQSLINNSNNSYNPQWIINNNNNNVASSGQMTTSSSFPANYPNYYINVKSNSSPQSSSMESADHYSDGHGMSMQDIHSLDQFLYQPYTS